MIVEDELDTLPPIVVLRLRNMTAIDATGLHAIEHLADRLHQTNRTLMVCGVRHQPAKMMARAEFHRHIGEDNILPTLEAAIVRARGLLVEVEEVGQGSEVIGQRRVNGTQGKE